MNSTAGSSGKAVRRDSLRNVTGIENSSQTQGLWNIQDPYHSEVADIYYNVFRLTFIFQVWNPNNLKFKKSDGYLKTV